MAERRTTVDTDHSLQQLLRARLENLPADPPAAELDTARVWYDTTLNRIRGYDGSVVRSVAWEGAPSGPQYDLVDLGSQYLLDPNERNGPGVLGIHDSTHTQDLGDSGAATVAWTLGGIMRPWDMRLVQAEIWYRINNVSAQAFGFFVGHATKVEDSTAALPLTMLWDEVADNGGVGPHDPANTRPFYTRKTINSATIPAGDTVTWGVDSPTADGTNRYVQISTGYLLFERL